MDYFVDSLLDAAPHATLLIRLMAGGVFLWEGVMKFVFPHTLGEGRFLKLGIPAPEFMAPCVGVMEIVGGTDLVVGLFHRRAALALLLDSVTATAHAALADAAGRCRPWGIPQGCLCTPALRAGNEITALRLPVDRQRVRRSPL